MGGHKLLRLGSLLIILFGILQLAGCLSLMNTVRIEETKITMASFSCGSLIYCWAFTDGDATGSNSGYRQGILELEGNEWKRKKAWGSFGFDKTKSGKPFVRESSISIKNEFSGWTSYNGKLYKRNPQSTWERNVDQLFSPAAEWILAPNPFHEKSGDEGTIRQVFFVDIWQGWITSASGMIARTDDRGAHWKISEIRPGQDFSSIFFLDSLQGWALSKDRELFKTINGGMDWVEISSLSESRTINQLYFTDSEHGWIVVEGVGSVWYTKDGGKTWNNSIPNADGLHSIYFFDPLHGWALKPGLGILHTTDGGKTWKHQEVSGFWEDHPANIIWKVPVWIIAVPIVVVFWILGGLGTPC